MDNITNSHDPLGSQNGAGVISQYKDLIREQDYKISALQITAKKSEDEIENLKQQIIELQQTNTQLLDQNILLKAQANLSNPQSSHSHSSTNEDVNFYKAENLRLQAEVDSLNGKLNDALEMTEQSLGLTEIGRMRKDQEDLLELLTDQVRIIINHKTFF